MRVEFDTTPDAAGMGRVIVDGKYYGLPVAAAAALERKDAAIADHAMTISRQEVEVIRHRAMVEKLTQAWREKDAAIAELVGLLTLARTHIFELCTVHQTPPPVASLEIFSNAIAEHYKPKAEL